jgi:hypothetical protein
MNMIDEFPEMDKSEYIADIIKDIKRAADSIAELDRIKSKLELQLSALLEHGEGKQTTYYEGGYKIVVKSSINYVLDKEKYEGLKTQIPEKFDPVRITKKEVVTYNLDKSVIRDYLKYANDDELAILDKIIHAKPISLSIDIGVPT